jgi:aldehyde dehydrogenase (NAD+)
MLKLSEALPATDELLLELIPKYFEPEALSAVVGGKEVVTKLLSFPFDFIFLTGSVGVGKVVMRAAAENLTPVLLELGGQNPAIVDETANVPDAAKKIVWGAMAWGGQWCTSPGYAVVHESIAQQFVAESKKAVVALYGADPKSNPDYSPAISPAAVERLASLIDPRKVFYGGKSDASVRYLDPTILYPISWSDKIMQDEIFGPLLPMLPYSDLGKLLASGIGNYYGKYGYDSLTHAKSVLISPPDVAIDHLFPPYTKEKVQALNQWFDY